LDQSKQLGSYVAEVVESFITHPTNDLLRAAQGLIKLSKKYGAKRLNIACQRAINFSAVSYKTVKEILEKGLDENYQPDEVMDSIDKVYQGGGNFQRPINTIIH